MKMRCEEWRRKFLVFLDGELEEGSSGVEEHLRRCAACRNQEHSLREFHRILKAGGDAALEPSSRFDQTFWERLASRRKEPWPMRLKRNVESWLPAPRPAEVFAVMILAFLVGGTGGVISTLNTWAPVQGQRLAVPSLSGFEEYKGVPRTSVAASYLKAAQEGTSS